MTDSCDWVEIGVCQPGIHQEDQRGDQGRVGRAAAVFVQCMFCLQFVHFMEVH
jgi:hypothetical protein